MKHSTTRENGNRIVTGITRMTVEKIDDTPLLQEAHLRGFHTEAMDTIEHAHPYGFTTHPKGPTEENGRKIRAEAFTAFLGGGRSHGVIQQVSDRRYRPNNLAEGEVVNHDDQGQQVYLSRDRVTIHAPKGKEVHVQTADGAHLLASKDRVKIQHGNLSVTITGGKIHLGKEGVSHAVMTADGPSTTVFASISETDTAMTAAPIATRTQKQQQQGQQGQG